MRRLPAVFHLVWALGIAGACAPRDAELHGRAILLVDRGRYDEARVLLAEHLRERPDDHKARRLLIRVHGFSGNLQAAREGAVALAAELGPAAPAPWIELGHALEFAHRYDEALDLYDRAAAIAPGNPSGPRTGGLRAAAWGEYELARPRLEEALRRAPRDATVWHALGVVCVGLGDLKSAERAYRSGLVADPRALENRIGLATLAIVRDEPAAALGQYDAILRERPRFGDAALGRSWALMRLGRLAEAETELARAEENGGDRGVVRRQRRMLAELRKRARNPDASAPLK